jgi:hypothetical protein
MSVSDASGPKQRVIKSPFDSLEEWGEWIEANAAPARSDDLSVIAGQPPGPRHRATHDELAAFLAAEGLDSPER